MPPSLAKGLGLLVYSLGLFLDFFSVDGLVMGLRKGPYPGRNTDHPYVAIVGRLPMTYTACQTREGLPKHSMLNAVIGQSCSCLCFTSTSRWSREPAAVRTKFHGFATPQLLFLHVAVCRSATAANNWLFVAHVGSLPPVKQQRHKQIDQ
jgi:hypothetical protein